MNQMVGVIADNKSVESVEVIRKWYCCQMEIKEKSKMITQEQIQKTKDAKNKLKDNLIDSGVLIQYTSIGMDVSGKNTIIRVGCKDQKTIDNLPDEVDGVKVVGIIAGEMRAQEIYDV